MTRTPIFDEVHRDLHAPPMQFADPDGLVICYGVPVYLNGRLGGTKAVLEMQLPEQNFPYVPILACGPPPWVDDGC